MKQIPLTKKERLAIIAGIGFLIIGYFAYQSFAGTTFGVTLKSTGILPGAPNLGSGLVSDFTFDGPTIVSNIADSGPLGNNARLVNFTATTSVQGKIGQALLFDGINDLVTIPSSASYNSSEGSWAFWYKSNTTNVSHPLLMQRADSVSSVNGITISLFTSASGQVNNLRLDVKNAGSSVCGTGAFVASTTGDTKWHHAVVTWSQANGGTDTLYVDGVKNGSSCTNGSAWNFNSQSVRLGTSADAFWDPYSGSLDDVRIYNRQITAAEVKRLYDLGTAARTSVSQQNAGTLSGGTDIASGLIGYWTFDGSKMLSNVGDSSGQGNTAYLIGFNSTTTSQGKVGGAISFTGGAATNEVRVPNATSLNPSAITLSAWIYSTGSDPSSNSERIVDKANQGTISQNGFRMQAFSAASCGSAAAEWGFQWYNGSAQLLCGPTIPSTTNTWTHIVFTHDGTTGKIYTNGSLTNSITTSYTGSNSFNLAIGNSDQVNKPFTGKIDDVRIYNRALSAAEVSALYTSSIGSMLSTSVNTSSNTGNALSAGLVGYWTFDGPRMTSNVTDSSGKGNTAYLRVFTSTTSTQGKVGQALSFNGSTNYVQSSASNAFSLTNVATLSAWVKTTSYHQARLINFYRTSGASGLVLGLAVDTSGLDAVDGQPFGAYRDAGNSFKIAKSATAINDGKWHLVSWVVSGSNGTLYVDGVSVSTVSDVNNANTFTFFTQKLTIGAFDNNSGTISANLSGPLDDVRIYNRALTASEVQRLYQLGK